jgi:hypothetical protein
MKAVILCIAACLTLRAADNQLTPAEKQAGFRLLFDGHTFNGWRDPASENPPGDSWVIEDGMLKTNPKPRIAEDLITQESFGNFELKFDWRISAKGNTGVKYRIQRKVFQDRTKADKSLPFEAGLEREIRGNLSNRATLAPGATAQEYTVSYEFQLIDDAGYPDLAKGDHLHDTGALYSMIPPKAKAAKPAGEWNQSRLVVNGDHFEHWINGVLVCDGSVHSPQSHAGTAKRWASAPTIRDMLINAGPTGPLSLQHHGAAVYFKNLKIRTM